MSGAGVVDQRDAGGTVGRPAPGRAPRQSLREVQKQLTRERLIEAAQEEFRSRGYNETTAENIAKAAGASRATFYVYFRSKAEVVAELMLRGEEGVLAAYRRLDALEDPDLANVMDWLDGTVELWRERASDFNTMEQALANDELVTETWIKVLGNSYKVMPRIFSRFPDPNDHEHARLHLLTLQMALDRTLFFAVIRERPVDMKILKEVLAAQWLEFVRRGT
ncbi:TetR/AcrR family transcriptional regulator [Arthrobacter sp. USHLN218]|uniref:TetR/AcrR family transcriptional regulator n=1 Tax=Arthrobacter sp. USHLN218 TaxID=3081232 RepID=UPI003017C15D